MKSRVRVLVADSLRCGQRIAAPLAELIFEKTGGNPFFAMQFLTALADESLLSFDYEATAWTWNLPPAPGPPAMAKVTLPPGCPCCWLLMGPYSL